MDAAFFIGLIVLLVISLVGYPEGESEPSEPETPVVVVD